ncbi:phage baseplate protein [Faecalimonas umbilicata]|uniref:phage baseplate protein n=1 Tax=Faecalimonas umbilicata TaxID=1912855 RepID=UPI0022E1D2C4|nr:phage tail protein [Faecalimonas umbilicata]
MVVVKNTRIAILSANNELITFMDNSHKKSIHYWNDELHEYLQGAAHTYTFTTDAKHPESFNIIEGNKISFILGEKQYYLNIVRVERTERNIMVEAWSLSFELTSEHVGAYKAEKAMSFEEYLRIFDAERTLRVGLNEITDRRITNEWTGDSTILARLFSLASVFDSEIEFQTVLNEDYSLKEIVLNVYRKQSDVDSGIGKFRDDFVLRYGKGISGITKTSDITELYTAIRPYGNDNMTISGMDKKEYDSNGNLLYYIEGDAIVAPQARDRFPSNFVNKAGAYIAVNKEYDTDSKEKLYDMALSDLKKSCVPVVTYDVSGYFETDIGDTVRIADEEFIPVLYLQARVVEQIRSLTNPETGRTVCSNFKELKTEISEDLLQKVEDLINKTKLYTSSISSDNGTIFKNNEGITSLTAYVRDNGVDKTEKFSVRWFKDGMPIYTGRTIKIRAEDVEVKAAYKFEARDKDEILRGFEEVTVTNISDGKPGKDGATYYTWIKYADDEYGNGISDSPDGKQYMGIANNKERMDESLDPADYQWSRITGEGIPGKPGADGKTYYTWVRYADDLYGNGMSDSPNGKYYIGLAFNKESQNESNNPQDYQWSKYRGDDGTPGVDGADGKTTYFHVKYSAVQNPTSSWEMTETPSKYIGTYVDFTMQDSTNPSDYTWSQFQGDPGENGIPGTNGQDGRTSYLHIAYANSSDGYTDFSTTNSTGKKYMGQYVDYTERDSENPYAYKWSKIKGEDGTDGQDGQDGVGISRITRYYLASNKNTGITTSTYGWTTTMQQITPEKKYLWSYENTAYTNGTSTNSIPIIIGVHGENGDSSGVTESDMPPNNPHMGMLWKNTGTSGGRVQGAVYRWNGSSWALFKLTASNIEAETFKGFEFIGAIFTSVDEFISPHHIDDNTVVEAKHKVNLKISKGAIVATDDLYFKQGSGWTSTPQEHRLTQILAGNGIYCYIEDYRTGERKRMSLDADGFEPPQSFFNLIYPVGSIYMSVNPINPSELFPLTAWAEWGKGRVPVGVDPSQTEFDAAEKTGGSKSVTLTGNQLPSHNHNVPKPEWYGVASQSDTGFGLMRTKNPTKDGSDGFTSTYTGKGEAHSNLQPYITCYMWVRTA